MLCEERGARGSSIQLLNEEMKQSDASIDMRSLLACPAQSQDAVGGAHGGAQCGGVPSGAASFTEEEMVINLEQLLAFAFESPNKKPWGSRFGGSLGNQQPPMGNAPCGNGAPARRVDDNGAGVAEPATARQVDRVRPAHRPLRRPVLLSLPGCD